MTEFKPESKCEMCGGFHPVGQCKQTPRIVIEHGQGDAMDFKHVDSLEIFKLALGQEVRNQGLVIQPAHEGNGFSIFDLLEEGKRIGEVELVHEATAGTAGWAKAFTINFIGFDGEGLSKSVVGNPEELSRMTGDGISAVREYHSKYGSAR